MNQYHCLQMRFPADSVAPGMSLLFQGSQYILGQPTPETLQNGNLPIGVLMSGYTKQYLLIKNNQPVGAAWFYFYRTFEGKFKAVLDEIEIETNLLG